MSTITPTGPLSLPLLRLQDLLVASAAFRTWVGAADEAAARAFAHLVAVNTPARPYAWIAHSPSGGWSYGRHELGALVGSSNNVSGQALLGFEAAIPSGSSHADAEFGFTNTVGAILKEMAAMAGNAGRIAIHSFIALGPPQRSSTKEKSSSEAAAGGGDYYRVLIGCNYSDFLE